MTWTVSGSARPRQRRAAVLAFLFALSVSLSTAPQASAATTSSIAGQLVTWVNQARAARGLKALRLDGRVSDLAADRATVLADAGILNHTFAGDIGDQLDDEGIQWYRYGEVLAWSSATFGTPSAWAIYTAWRGSPSHWVLLMSDDYNYLGTGIAVRSENGATYASILLTESVDQTPPKPVLIEGHRYHTTVAWSYRAWEPPLQTHTAGVRDFDVEYRIDDGEWTRVRDGTSATILRLYGRQRGHWHGLRIRARDRRGNVSGWTPETRIWVP